MGVTPPRVTACCFYSLIFTLPQDQCHIDFLWPRDSTLRAACTSCTDDAADAGATQATRPAPPRPLAPTPRPRARPALAPTPATGRVEPLPRRCRPISMTPERVANDGGIRVCSRCGAKCADEYCACGARVRRSPHHPRQQWGIDALPEASTTPAVDSRRHDDIPIHITNSASQSRMAAVDNDDAPPFELTELDRLALSSAYASDDSSNYSLGIDDPDLLDIPPPMTYEAWSVGEMECDAE